MLMQDLCSFSELTLKTKLEEGKDTAGDKVRLSLAGYLWFHRVSPEA